MDNIYPPSRRSLPSLLRLSLAPPYTTGAPLPPAPAAQPVPSSPPWVPSYAYPWPDAIIGLGRRRVDAYAPCEGPCQGWSWVRYGAAVLCLECATRAIGGEG